MVPTFLTPKCRICDDPLLCTPLYKITHIFALDLKPHHLFLSFSRSMGRLYRFTSRSLPRIKSSYSSLDAKSKRPPLETKMGQAPEASVPRSRSRSPSPTRPSSRAPSVPQKLIKLSLADLAIVKHSLGCTTDPESHLIHSTSTLYQPRNLPCGLYRSVLLSRTISQYQYLSSSLIFNLSLVLQVLLGAAITALGSSDTHSIAVTISAATNTVIAGLLALMHNSGLPGRYKSDWNEFEELEWWL